MTSAQTAEIAFTSIEDFLRLQRMANFFVCSSMFSQTFQGQLNIGNYAIPPGHEGGRGDWYGCRRHRKTDLGLHEAEHRVPESNTGNSDIV